MMIDRMARFCVAHRAARSAALAILGIALAGSLWSVFPRAASAATAGAFQVAANPGGGNIITGTLGNSSLPDATAALMRRVHAELGSRPVVVQTALNSHDHSLALLFTANRDNVPYTGVAIVTADAGAQAAGAALYDVSSRFHTTIGTMLHRLQGMTQPAPASRGAIALAPAEPLITRSFSDGTGSIGLPSDWTLGPNGGGGAIASGPAKSAQVSYNMQLMGLDPTSPRSQMLLRTQTPLARKLFPGVVLDYTSDPVKAWTSMYAAMARKHGLPPPQIRITSSTPAGSAGANISGTLGSGPKAIHFIAYVFVLPPDPNGFWKVSDSHMFVTEANIAQQARTANAVLESVQINFGAVAAQQSAMRQMFQQKFEQEIAIDRTEDAERQQRTDEALASDRAAQEGMHKEAVSMENYSLDRAVVVDTRNGDHSTVDSGFADTLVHDNPNYQKVPAANLLRGVDY
jgi:hypothetical protein